MDIHNHRFDMTDPLAQVKHRFARTGDVLKQISPAQRQVVVRAMQRPTATPSQRCIDEPLTTTLIPARDWDSSSAAMSRATMTTFVHRSRRVRQPQPLACRWWVAGVRFKRRISKQWQHQLRQCKRELRSLLRQALRHLHGRARR